MKPDLPMRLTEEIAGWHMRVQRLRRAAKDAFAEAQTYAASASMTGAGLSCRLSKLQAATEALVTAETVLTFLTGLTDE